MTDREILLNLLASDADSSDTRYGMLTENEQRVIHKCSLAFGANMTLAGLKRAGLWSDKFNE